MGPRTKSRTNHGPGGSPDVHQGGARGDPVGVPPQRAERQEGLQGARAFPERGKPVSLAPHGGGGGARREGDARPAGAHALRARRGQPPVRGAAPAGAGGGGRCGGTRADGLAGLGRRPAGGPGRAGEDGRGEARRGAGGVGRPKSTRPGLFDQHGEVDGRGAGPGEEPPR